VPTRELKYRLGRSCVLTVDGVALASVKNAYLRVRAVTQEVTGPGNTASSEIVLRRDHSIEFDLLDFDESQFLDGKIASAASDPIVEVSVQGGHINRVFLATIGDASESQGITEVVAPQWTLKQWGQRTTV
jgi:hypothetical protein